MGDVTERSSSRHAAAEHRSSSTKIVLASLVGSSIEWFDYFLFGTLAAIVFSKLYFPTENPTVGIMLAYLSFALTFFVRPFGGIIFSFIGDRVGRKHTLTVTLNVMGVSTAAIGLVPTYDQIGILAPVAIVILRLAQGIGIGGQWGSALLIAYEHAPPGRRGLFGSLPQAGVTIGMLLSTISVSLVSLLPEDAFMSWGWRLPFLSSIVLVAVSRLIRTHLDETPAFLVARRDDTGPAPHPLIATIRDHRRPLVTAIMAKIVETAPFYIFTIFMVSYTTGILGYSRLVALSAVSIGALVSAITIPMTGWMSDAVGRQRTFLIGCALMAVFAFPYFGLLSLREPLALTVATVIAMGLVWPLVTAVLGTMFSEIFDADVRYTGITLGYQIGAALAGGTAPLIATWLLAQTDDHWWPIASLIVGAAALSSLAVLMGTRPSTTVPRKST